jgi:hypothetical protein
MIVVLIVVMITVMITGWSVASIEHDAAGHDHSARAPNDRGTH